MLREKRPGDQPCFAIRLVSEGNETQGWRVPSHTEMAGAEKFGSAKLPMATATIPGKASFSKYTVEPQVGQKLHVSALPLSPVRFHAVALPLKVICSRRNCARLPMTAPVRRWHSRQWQIQMRDGSP
jgi:hypothetical protein